MSVGWKTIQQEREEGGCQGPGRSLASRERAGADTGRFEGQ